MPTYPILRFVDAPTMTANVRYDLQAAPALVLHDGVSHGSPTLEGQADRTGRPWGFRRVSFTQIIEGTHAVAVPLIAGLARELMRPTNWLHFQLSATSVPVWFRTYLTQPGEISFEYVYEESLGRSVWAIAVALDADPWMLGVRQTVTAFTMGNNPATGTNPQVYTLPAIVGDMAAPLRIRASGADFREYTAYTSVLASDVAPTGTIIATVGTLGTDAVTATDGLAIGGSVTSISFANPSMLPRINYSGPSLRHGTYKALLRVAGTGGNTYRAQLWHSTSSVTPSTDTTFTLVPGTGQFHYVDLGEFDWPPGGRVGDVDFLTTSSSSLTLSLFMSKITGGGFSVDELVLVPVGIETDNADTLIATYPGSNATSVAMFIDGETESIRTTVSGDVLSGVTIPAVARGQFPYVVPGRVNVFRFMQSMRGRGTLADSISGTTILALSYQPRWLYLANV